MNKQDVSISVKVDAEMGKAFEAALRNQKVCKADAIKMLMRFYIDRDKERKGKPVFEEKLLLADCECQATQKGGLKAG